MKQEFLELRKVFSTTKLNKCWVKDTDEEQTLMSWQSKVAAEL